MDRACASGAQGRRFNSCQARHFFDNLAVLKNVGMPNSTASRDLSDFRVFLLPTTAVGAYSLRKRLAAKIPSTTKIAMQTSCTTKKGGSD